VPPATVQNAQVLEATVNGPDEANRLFTCTGNANFFMNVANGNQTQTFTFLVGPTLTRPQFHRATGTASVAGFQAFVQAGANVNYSYRVNSVEVDWDDESGQIEVRVEIAASASAGVTLGVNGLSYYVAVLAEL
jgi:hypothetical protein